MIPTTFQEFLFLLFGDVLFLGALAATLTGGLIRELERQRGPVGEHARRWISLALPFGVAAGAYLLAWGIGYHTPTPDSIYQATVTAFMAATGKQVVYAGYQAFIRRTAAAPAVADESGPQSDSLGAAFTPDPDSRARALPAGTGLDLAAFEAVAGHIAAESDTRSLAPDEPSTRSLAPFAGVALPGPLPPVLRTYRPDLQHYTPDRGGHAPELIVVHNTAGVDSRAWLTTTSPAGSRVSIHKLIRAEGVYAMVAPRDTAWHVGEANLPKANFRSLGLEIENRSNGRKIVEPYRDTDYLWAAHTVAGWMFSYGIPWERVYPHKVLAMPPGRRFDPCPPWDWERLHRDTMAWLRFFQALDSVDHPKYIY